MSHKQYEVTMKASEPSTVNLRAMEPCDIDAIYRWENDPSVWGVSMSHQPFSRYALSRFIDENSGSDIYASRQLRLMADSGGTTVGCIDLYDFDPYHRRAGVGLLVDSRMRRQGFGMAMLKALETFAVDHLEMHQLHCVVAADNEASIALFTKVGYAQCGVLHDWVASAGKWLDALSFQRIL